MSIPTVTRDNAGEKSIRLTELQVKVPFESVSSCASSIVNDDRLPELGANVEPFKGHEGDFSPCDLAEIVCSCGVSVFCTLPSEQDKHDMAMAINKYAPTFYERAMVVVEILLAHSTDGSYAIIEQDSVRFVDKEFWRMRRCDDDIVTEKMQAQWYVESSVPTES